MIKVLTAFTEEIDDIELAANEIVTQLDPEHNLMKRSVGIVACHQEFVDSGAFAAICERLPFDVSGVNTLHNAVPGHYGQYLLSLAVLTSDDVIFSTAVSAPISRPNKTPITDAYNQAAAALKDKPAMILSFSPFLSDVGGDEISDAISTASGGLPNFGTLAFDYTTTINRPMVLNNGKCYPDCVAMILLAGNVNPEFSIFSIPDQKIRKQKAIITKSTENVLEEINNIPAMKYMESLGLATNGTIVGLQAIPLVLDYNDGTQAVARTVMNVSQDGGLVCGGSVPADCSLSVGVIDMDDIVQTMDSAIHKLENAKGGAIIFSCATRNFTLETNYSAEMDKLMELTGKLPFIFCYSGGEFCPVPGTTSRYRNRFHNVSLICCAF